MNNKFVPEESLRQARARLPFERLLEQLGHAPPNRKWKSFTCPFCRKKAKAGLFQAENGLKLFKCHSTSCPTGAKAMDEVSYLVCLTGRSRRDAFIDYLKQAGVWSEGPITLSAQPEQAAESELRHDSGILRAIDGDGDDSTGEEEVQPDGVQGFELEPDGLDALKSFYEQTVLTEEDEHLLFKKRGLAAGAVRRLGFRSNTRDNLVILESMPEEFPMKALIESGLWQSGEEPRPNPQFHGWGRIGRRKTAEENSFDDEHWAWVQPLLIPYFDTAGFLTHLRPHKGGVKGKPARLYVPRTGGQKNVERYEQVIVTEGEFKAAALWQRARLSSIGIAALPGVQMANNYNCREELEHWLKEVGARRVFIIYDNEEKGDPSLPGYKPEWDKRYDAQIWAHVLAGHLKHFDAVVGHLPKSWRIEGKADWDGALASFVNQRMNPEKS